MLVDTVIEEHANRRNIPMKKRTINTASMSQKVSVHVFVLAAGLNGP